MTNKEEGSVQVLRYVRAPGFWVFKRNQPLTEERISPCRAIYGFYTSPVTKFYLSLVTVSLCLWNSMENSFNYLKAFVMQFAFEISGFIHCIFGLFTVVVLAKQNLFDLNDSSPLARIEIVLWVWAVILFLEELRQVNVKTNLIQLFGINSYFPIN